MTENDNNFEEMRDRHSVSKMSYADKGRFFAIRNILNILFILLTCVGMVVYLMVSESIGGVILVTAVLIKIVECVLRIMH